MKLFPQIYSDNNLETLHYGQAFRHAAATPLSSLLINLELAQSHRTQQNNPYVNQALQSAYRLQELFKKPKTLQSKQSFFVKPFIKESLSLIRHKTHQDTINTHLNFPQDTQLKGSRFYFQEAIICTLNNSLESYSARETSKRIILITGQSYHQKLQLSFTDGGQGMNWIEKSLMFADGYTSKNQGSGFGLTWVKKVIEDHFHGKITVKSKKHHGTTITWTLPLIK